MSRLPRSLELPFLIFVFIGGALIAQGCRGRVPGNHIEGAAASPDKLAESAMYWAGAAVEDITPSLQSIQSRAIPTAGYLPGGACSLRGSGLIQAVGIQHNISARALAIGETPARRFVIIALDVLSVDERFVRNVRARLATSRGLGADQLVVHATHTHTAPLARPWPTWAGFGVPDDPFMSRFEQAAVLAAERAIDAMQPAAISIGRGVSNIGIERRYPNAPQDYDKTLDVLQATTSDGTPIAIAFFYACHPVSIGYIKECDDCSREECKYHAQISPDFPGTTRDRIEAAHPGVTALFIQGFGGTINPAWLSDGFGVATMERVGNQLAADVESVLTGSMRTLRTQALSTALTRVNLPVRPADETDPDFGGMSAIWSAAVWRGERLHAYESLPTDVQSIRVGRGLDAWRLITSSNEIVNEYATSVRDAFWLEPTVTLAGYSNGVLSYLPTRRIVEEGGYEGRSAHVTYGLVGPPMTEIENALLTTVDLLQPWSSVGRAYGVVGLTAARGALFAVSRGDWRIWTRPADRVTDDADWTDVGSAPTDVIGLASDGESLFALTAAGNIRVRAASTDENLSWTNAGVLVGARAIAVAAGKIYLARNDSRLWMRDAIDSLGSWTDAGEANSVSNMAATAGRLYAIDDTYNLWTRDVATERRPWKVVRRFNSPAILAATDVGAESVRLFSIRDTVLYRLTADP